MKVWWAAIIWLVGGSLTGSGWLVVHWLVGRPEGSVGWHIKVFYRLDCLQVSTACGSPQFSIARHFCSTVDQFVYYIW